MLPAVAMDVQWIIDRDGATGELIRAIEREPTVAAGLIRFANSAVYVGLAEIHDLEGAIARLGRSRVRRMVISLLAKSAFADGRTYQEIYKTLWEHSVLTATAARHLAPLLRVPEETAFVAGLLHDIGKVVVLRALTTLQHADPIAFSTSDELARALLDELHCQVGADLCLAWNIPLVLAAAIGHHHDALLAQEGNELVATVQLADLMAAKIGVSFRPDLQSNLGEHPLAGLFGLDEATLTDRLQQAEQEYRSIVDIL